MSTRTSIAGAFVLAAASGATAVVAAEHEVGQKDKAFTVESLTVEIGDIVKFTNEDTTFHNVFSLSDAKSFDLGTFPKGSFKTVEFDAAGEVEVECAIHPDMIMTIHVVE